MTCTYICLMMKALSSFPKEDSMSERRFLASST
jgi:hypothetical protein